jgi:RNA recognition motif-containing protein
MIDKTRGCSRQIGFVRFVNIADATKALKAMNGYVLEPGTPPIVGKFVGNFPVIISESLSLSLNSIQFFSLSFFLSL